MSVAALVNSVFNHPESFPAVAVCLFGVHAALTMYLGMKELLALQFFADFYENKAYKKFGSYWESLEESASDRDAKSSETRLRMDGKVVGSRVGALIRAVGDDMGLSPREKEFAMPFCCDHVEPQVNRLLSPSNIGPGGLNKQYIHTDTALSAL